MSAVTAPSNHIADRHSSAALRGSKNLNVEDINGVEKNHHNNRKSSGEGTRKRPFSFNLRKYLTRGGSGGDEQLDQLQEHHHHHQQQQNSLGDSTSSTSSTPNGGSGSAAAGGPKLNGHRASAATDNNGDLSHEAGSSSTTPGIAGPAALLKSPYRQRYDAEHGGHAIASPPHGKGGGGGGTPHDPGLEIDGVHLGEESSLNGTESVRTLGSILPNVRDAGLDHDDGGSEGGASPSSPDKGASGGGGHHVWSGGGDASSPAPSTRSDKGSIGGSLVGGSLRPTWKSHAPGGFSSSASKLLVQPTPEDDNLSDAASGVAGTEDQGYWSDEMPPQFTTPGCLAEKCLKEKRRLQRMIEELKQKIDVSDEASRKYMSEILDLRQQVAMLSGFGPGTSGEGDGQYMSSYDVVTKEPSMTGHPAPFAGHRIKHQRINPDLIIKEKDIVIEKIVGVGSFGKVWKGVYDGRPVAIKCFYSEDADVIGEINLMERVNGKPHVLPLEGVYLSNDTGEEAQVALVTPFMENGSLYDVIVNRKAPQYRASVSMNTIVKIAMQTADGVRSLHQENVIHRDLACRNILVSGDLDCYVSDFGFARQKENKSSKGFTKNNMGPVKWEAPESLQRKEYSEKTDAFSYAVCLYEMVSAKEPWEHETHAQVAYQVICGNRLPIALNCDPVLAELMQLCWEADPRKRPNFEYNYRRLKERHTQLQNEEREISGEKQLVYQLRQGTTFYKLPYLKGKPHKRQFKVSEDLRRLKWCFLPTRNFMQRARDPVRPATKQVFLTEVQDIRMGMRTANFRRIENVEKFRGRAAFSIITQDRTIDILCPTPEIMDQWVLGLRFLVDRLRPPPPPLPASALDRFTVMAKLRRGGFMLKFGQIGRPHERYFRVSANMKLLLWTSGETPGKGVHKSVDLASIKDVRLFHHAQPGVAAVVPTLNLLSKGVDDLQFGFSLINQQGQADINLVAPNAFEYGLWTRGLELIVRNFQDEEAMASATPMLVMVGGDQAPPVYDRGDYLELDGQSLGLGLTGGEDLGAGSSGSGGGVGLGGSGGLPSKWRPMKGLPEIEGGDDRENEAAGGGGGGPPARHSEDDMSGLSPNSNDGLERSVTMLAGRGAVVGTLKPHRQTGGAAASGGGDGGALSSASWNHSHSDSLTTPKPSSAVTASDRSAGEPWSPLSQTSSHDGHAHVIVDERGGIIGGGGGMMVAPSPQINFANHHGARGGGGGGQDDGEEEDDVDYLPQDIYASGAAILQMLEEEKERGKF